MPAARSWGLAGGACLVVGACLAVDACLVVGAGAASRLRAAVLADEEVAVAVAPQPGWQMAGEVLVPGVLNEGDIDKTDGCRRAAELARSL